MMYEVFSDGKFGFIILSCPYEGLDACAGLLSKYRRAASVVLKVIANCEAEHRD